MNHGPAVQDVERPPLRLRDCYWFFGPLVLMVELNMMSKSVIHAFLARTDNPSAVLAAFNAAFTFYFAITATSEVTTVLCLSFLKSRANSLRLSTFAAIVLSLPITIALAVAFTPVGNMAFGSWFGLGSQAQLEARGAVGLLIVSAPFLIVRANAFALLDAGPTHVHYHLEHSGPAAVADSLACAAAHVAERRCDRRCSACHLYGDRGDLCLGLRLAASDGAPGRTTVKGDDCPLLELCVAIDHKRLGRASDRSLSSISFSVACERRSWPLRPSASCTGLF